MAEDLPSSDERTEPASARKKEESRKQGKVAKSVELNTALALVTGLFTLFLVAGFMVRQVMDIGRSVFANASRVELTPASVQYFLGQGAMRISIIVAPVAIGLMVVGLAASFVQVGFVFSFEALQPRWSKLNPLQGIKNVFLSRRSSVELIKGSVKIIIVGLVAYYSLDTLLSDSVTLVDADLQTVGSFMAKGALSVGLKSGIAMLVLSVFDYAFQKFEYERNLRMTKQEAKEEFKMQEGDPLIKGRIKTIQRQIAYKRMMSDVPTADVVVTNPTHLALALKYDGGSMAAPKLVAKGADLIAQRIREIAQEHHIPIVEDKPLAQALYKTVEVGEEIPEKLFQAVAQVLAYIYRMRDEHLRKKAGHHRGNQKTHKPRQGRMG